MAEGCYLIVMIIFKSFALPAVDVIIIVYQLPRPGNSHHHRYFKIDRSMHYMYIIDVIIIVNHYNYIMNF